jgi:hypothetical protein
MVDPRSGEGGPVHQVRQRECTIFCVVESIPRRLVFRIPGVALVGVLFAFASGSVVALAGPKPLLLVYLIPLGVGIWVLRTRTVVDNEAIRVRRMFTSHSIDWNDLAGLRVPERTRLRALLGSTWMRAVLAGGRQVALPCVKPRHLPVLALLSGGRLPDPTQPRPNNEAPVAPAEIASGTGANA